jgi:hypothetical protein
LIVEHAARFDAPPALDDTSWTTPAGGAGASG